MLEISTDHIDAPGADGTLVQLRDLGPADRQSLLELHDHASHLAEPGAHRAIGAFIGTRLAGVGSFSRVSDRTAELTLHVADDLQHAGLGTLLLEHIIVEAGGSGVRRFVAEVPAENSLMIGVLQDLGSDAEMTREHGSLTVSFSLSDWVVDAIAESERRSSAASLRPLLTPRSVVVVGAGQRPGSAGHEVLRNLIAGGFTGSLHVVDPERTDVLGVPAVPSARQLPLAPDLVVVALTAPEVAGVLRDCGERGARSAVVLDSGFGESGSPGANLQDQVLAIAREYGMRLLGPNCIGLLNTDPRVRLDATVGRLSRRRGNLAVLAQSGAFGATVVAAADRVGLGTAQFASVGNAADVGGNDLLPIWQDDPHVRVIAMYLQSIGDPRRFARVARTVSRRKPIIAIKPGRTEAGRHAGRSHTAAAASPDVAVDALFCSSGVLRVDSTPQLIDAARVLVDQPLAAGRRIAIIGNSGGPEILAAAAAGDAGLDVTDFDEATQRALSDLGAPTRNPVDLGAAVTPATVAGVLRAVLCSPSVDLVLTVFTDLAVTDAAAVRAALAANVATADKPVAAVEVGAQQASVPLPDRPRSMPIFSFPEPAAAALGVAARYAHWRASGVDPPTRPDVVDLPSARALVGCALASGGGWLRADEATRLLRAYGIPICPERVVAEGDAAVAAADEFGYPVALKLAAAGIHKSDIGGVRLGLADATQVRAAAADLALLDSEQGRAGTALVVQPMITDGVELIVGGVHEPLFGPLVMLGAGGVLTDVLGDRTFRLAPLSAAQARDMIAELRSARLLDGYRGRAPASRAAVEDVLLRIATLMADLPEIAELDLNPLAVGSDVAIALDARVRLAPAAPHPDPLVRQLRGSWRVRCG